MNDRLSATTTVRLLEAWKAKKGLDSDYKAAKELGVATGTPSNWRHGRSHAAPALASRMAKETGLDELAVLAAIEADRAHNGDDRRVWQKHGRAAFMALLVGVVVGVPPAGHATQLSRMGQGQPLTPGQNLPLCEIRQPAQMRPCLVPPAPQLSAVELLPLRPPTLHRQASNKCLAFAGPPTKCLLVERADNNLPPSCYLGARTLTSCRGQSTPAFLRGAHKSPLSC
jgi:DNA-binding transcriptional regulator YdaS (Cro superfamily)